MNELLKQYNEVEGILGILEKDPNISNEPVFTPKQVRALMTMIDNQKKNLMKIMGRAPEVKPIRSGELNKPTTERPKDPPPSQK